MSKSVYAFVGDRWIPFGDWTALGIKAMADMNPDCRYQATAISGFVRLISEASVLYEKGGSLQAGGPLVRWIDW